MLLLSFQRTKLPFWNYLHSLELNENHAYWQLQSVRGFFISSYNCWIPCNGVNTLTISKSLFLVTIVVVYEVEWCRVFKALEYDVEWFMLSWRYIWLSSPSGRGRSIDDNNYWILPLRLTIHSPLLCGLLLARCHYLHRFDIVRVGHPTQSSNQGQRVNIFAVDTFACIVSEV